MATSLFDKVRVAVLGNLHNLLDDVSNTPAAYKQRIRDLESALADLRSAHDEAVGTANGYRRDLAELEGKKAATLSDVDLLIGDDDPSNDEAALELQSQVLDQFDPQIEQLSALIVEADANRAALDKAVDQLESKHREMVNGLNRLTLSAAATSAKNRASAAAEAALEASTEANVASIDSIAARINRDRDVADARFDRVIGGLEHGDDPEKAVRLARAKAAIQARRAQIADAATPSTLEDTPAASS